jgi:acyl carrier protein
MDLDSILRSTKRKDGSDFFNEEIAQSYDSSAEDSEEIEDEYEDNDEEYESDETDEDEEYESDETDEDEEYESDETDEDEETSTIEVQNMTYDFDTANGTVGISIDRIDNKSSWTTGDLEIACYISDHNYTGGDLDDSYMFVGEEIIGHLEPGYGFPNLEYSFNVDKSILPGSYKRWRFVFLICELNNDDEWYIIDHKNGRCYLTDIDRITIINTLIDKLGVNRSEIHDDADLVNDFGADSLDLIELTMEFEKKFGLSIPLEDVENIRTVGDIFDYVRTVL